QHFQSRVGFAASIHEPDQMLLFDPQTSGGLLLGVPRSALKSFVVRAREIDQAIWIVGSVETGTGIEIR
ncbi:MAG TPA: selenide, water dikinase SelD, partial [Anaerolineales bacterium]